MPKQLARLVTPESLRRWERVFADQSLRQRYLDALRFYSLVAPRVRPRDDGSVAVLYIWQHPDQTEVEMLTTPQLRDAHAVVLRAVETPDDWRVEDIE